MEHKAREFDASLVIEQYSSTICLRIFQRTTMLIILTIFFSYSLSCNFFTKLLLSVHVSFFAFSCFYSDWEFTSKWKEYCSFLDVISHFLFENYFFPTLLNFPPFIPAIVKICYSLKDRLYFLISSIRREKITNSVLTTSKKINYISNR